MNKLNIYSSLAKLILVSTVLLTGCSQTTELKPTPPTTGNEVPPTTEVVPTPEVTKQPVTEGNIIIERPGEEYDENGKLIHNHPLDDFDEFLRDAVNTNGLSPGMFCNYLKENEDAFVNYQNTNGEVKNYFDEFYIEDGYMVNEEVLEKANNICGDDIEAVKNYK